MTSFAGPKANRNGWGTAAARYRERRVNRALYGLAALLLIGPWALWLYGLLAGAHLAMAYTLLTPQRYVQENLQTLVLGSGLYTNFDVAVAAGLGIALFAYDRLAGGLLTVLEGPLTRRAIVGAKLLYGGGLLVGATALVTLAVLIVAWTTGNGGLTGAILLHAAYAAAAQGDAFATALAMATAMRTVNSVVATGTWLAWPSLLSSLVSTLFVTYVQRREVIAGHAMMVVVTAKPVGSWVFPLAGGLPNLAPFQGQWGAWPVGDQVALVVGFLGWAVVMAALAFRWWTWAPYERLHDTLYFPALWPFYYAFLALATALVLTTAVTAGSLRGAAWAAVFLAIAIAAWFFWRFVIEWRFRRYSTPPERAARL